MINLFKNKWYNLIYNFIYTIVLFSVLTPSLFNLIVLTPSLINSTFNIVIIFYIIFVSLECLIQLIFSINNIVVFILDCQSTLLKYKKHYLYSIFILYIINSIFSGINPINYNDNINVGLFIVGRITCMLVNYVIAYVCSQINEDIIKQNQQIIIEIQPRQHQPLQNILDIQRLQQDPNVLQHPLIQQQLNQH